MNSNLISNLAILLGFLLIISMIVEIESCGGGGGKGGWGKEKGGWGKEKKKKKAKRIMSSYYDDDDDYEPYVRSPRHHHHRVPTKIVETRYVDVPRYFEMPMYQQIQRRTLDDPYLATRYPSPSSSYPAYTDSVQQSYELQMQPITYQRFPARDTLRYNDPIAKPEWPSKHPILTSLFRKIIED